MTGAPRKLVAILAADVAGYARLMGADEEGTLTRLKAHRRELIDPKIAEHHGRIVKTSGDGMLVEFASPVEAVRCAVEVQRGMCDRDTGLPVDRRIRFRVGVNLGDVIVDGKDIYGDGVNVAARLEALADPGGLCVSQAVHDQVRDKLSYAFEDDGEREVKNIARPVRVFRLSSAAIEALPVISLLAAPRRSVDPRMTAAVVALAAVIAIGGGVWWLTAASRVAVVPSAAEARRLSIVILPFANLSSDPDHEYFVDGLTENLTTDVSRIAGSFVIARNTAFTFKGKAIDVKQVSRDLGVRYAMTGSVRRAGGKVTVNAELVDAATGASLWSDRFDGDATNLADLQSAVALRLVRSLSLQLPAEEVRRAYALGPEAAQAVDLGLRARAIMNRPFTPDNAEEVIRTAARALDIDPGNTDALISRASARIQKVNTYYSDSPTNDLRLAEIDVDRALALEPRRAWAYYIKGNLLRHLHQTEAALQAYEMAISLDRSLAVAYMLRGFAKLQLGRPEEMFPAIEEARRISPHDPFLYLTYTLEGLAHLALGRDEDALSAFRKSGLETPQLSQSLIYLTAALALTGRDRQAKDSLARLKAVAPAMTLRRFEANWQSEHPVYLAMRARIADGLRKAGLPE